jgi:hypothetical protein
MSPRNTVPLIRFFVFAFALMLGIASAQTEKRLSAREIFYSPPAAPAPVKKNEVPRSKKASADKPVETASGKATPSRTSTHSVTADSGPRVQTLPAAYSTENAIPLGLRYSILKREGSGSTEVDPDTIFHSGDKIRLRVDVNAAGYLYIINRGSSGNWNPLFPSPKIANGDNRVQKGTQYEIPPGYVFTFDEQAGTEKLFIVFSRQPVADLDDLIYSISDGKKPGAPPQREDNKILMAQANIQDGMIDRLRNVYMRDLIIEKVDETKTPPPAAPEKEKAVYIVNPTRSADSRVVADVTLIHK